MSLFSIFDISGSAMTAQSKRLNVSASNMANADSVAGPDGKPYRARQVIFSVDNAAGQEIGGVKVSDVTESTAPDRLVYEPANPRRMSRAMCICRMSMWWVKWSTPFRHPAATRPTSK